jgi:hypothetical protein
MTVKELIEELNEIDDKYLDCEIVVYNNGSANLNYPTSVDDEPAWDDRDEIYLNVD